MEKLKVFLSWSGPRSKVVVEALRTWLPDVLPMTEPWMSAADIEPGAKWRQVISGELEATNFAILCLTPENLLSPWLLFEAGALSKHSDARVCTYLVDLNPTDVKDPLSQFQHTRATEAETKQLVATINKKLEFALDDARLDRTFARWWPDLETLLRELPADPLGAAPKNPIEKVPEMVTEILERVREQNSLARADAGFASIFFEERAISSEVLLKDVDRALFGDGEFFSDREIIKHDAVKKAFFAAREALIRGPRGEGLRRYVEAMRLLSEARAERVPPRDVPVGNANEPHGEMLR